MPKGCLILEDSSFPGASIEGQFSSPPTKMTIEVEDLGASRFANMRDRRAKRPSLRDMSLPKSFCSDSTSEDSDDANSPISRESKRRQMKHDLRKLERCMAKTGAAVVAASMIGGSPIDGVSYMDQASKFRRQKKPMIPELYPKLYADEQTDLGLVSAFGKLNSGADETVSLLSLREHNLEEGALKELSSSDLSNIAPGLTLTDWDRVSEVGSEAGFQAERETVSISGSNAFFERKPPASSELHSSCVKKDSKLSVEGYIDFMACLDFMEVIGDLKAKNAPASEEEPLERAMSVHSLDDNTELPRIENASNPPPNKALHNAFTPSLFVLASNAKNAVTQPVKQIAAHCRDVVSTVANFLGEPPQQVSGNFGSPSEVWLAMQSIVRGNAEEQHTAKVFLFCTLGFLVLFMLCFLALTLMILAFAAVPDCQEVPEIDTALLAEGGPPKSMSKILTVVMISVLAGSGLAISHPMFDAILSGT